MESTRRQQPVIPACEPRPGGPPAPVYRLRTLGDLRVDGPAGEVRTLRRKERILLAYLARAAAPVRRAELMALLWGRQTEARAKHSLRQALCALRKAVPGAVGTDAEQVAIEPGTVELDLAALECDVRHGRSPSAAARWRGEFLAGLEDSGAEPLRRWIEAERAAVRQLVSTALDSLVAECHAGPAAAMEAALGPVRRWAEAHPWDEAAQARLIRLLRAAGREREGAALHARAAERLREELGHEPSPAFGRLSAAAPDSDPAQDVVAGWTRARAGGSAAVQAVDARAVEDVVTSAHAMGAVVLRARGDGARVPWRFARELLRPLRAARGVSAACDHAVAELASLVPELRARWPHLPPPSGDAVRLMGGVRATLAEVAAEAPVLIVAEDVADADAESRRLIATLAAGLPPATLLLLVGDAAPAVAPLPLAAASTTARGQDGVTHDGSAADVASVATSHVDDASVATPRVNDASVATPRVDDAPVATSPADDASLRTSPADDAPAPRRRAWRRPRLTVVPVAAVIAALALVLPRITGSDAAQGGHSYQTTNDDARAAYDAGLHALQSHRDSDRALQLFTDALERDSSFALAAYFAGVAAGEVHGTVASSRLLTRAETLAARLPERERMYILASAALRFNDPTAADRTRALARRYPDGAEGGLLLASTLMQEGRFLDAAAALQRVIALEPPGGTVLTGQCTACVAYELLAAAWWMADSAAAALRAARTRVTVQPGDAAPLLGLAGHLTLHDEFAEAATVRQRAIDAGATADILAAATDGIRAARFELVDAGLAYIAQGGGTELARQTAWLQAISYRNQRRYADAWHAATRYRELSSTGPAAVHPFATVQAIVLLESGNAARAAAMFDTMFHTLGDYDRPSRLARDQAWLLTLRAAALATAGDTARLAALADSIQRLGMRSSYGRDRRLHHHVRGLLLAARGDLRGAETQFRSAIYSPTAGYTRTNVELARVLLRQQRPTEAIAPLRSALRAPLDGPALYVTRTELYELLARAYEGAGRADSAAVFSRLVASSTGGDEEPVRRAVARR